MTNYIFENILVCIVWHFISEYLYFYNHLCYYNLFSSNDVFLYNESRNKYFCTSQSSDTVHKNYIYKYFFQIYNKRTTAIVIILTIILILL